MSFKSTVQWPTQGANLTTYEGGVPGKSSVRKAVGKVGGTDGIRKTEWVDADGNTYRLSTRNGFPEVVTSRSREGTPEPTTAPRGFLAHNPESSYAALFSPYSLEVLKADHKTYGHSYTVLPFSSPYNVPLDDTTKWNDVLSFYGGTTLVNGKAMPELGGSGAAAYSFPWLIPATGEGVAVYGDSSVKRVFSISRSTVHSWAADAVDAELGGATYRAENKAMLCGARVDRGTGEAVLSQLVYTGAAWDDFFSGWAQFITKVSMRVTAPYLPFLSDAYSVEGFTASPSTAATVPLDSETAYNPGAAPVCAFGPLYLGQHNVNPTYGTSSSRKYVPDLSVVYMREPHSSKRLSSGSMSSFSGENTQQTPGVCGELTVSVTVEKTYSVIGETVSAELSGATPSQTHTTPTEVTEYPVIRDNSQTPYFNPEPTPATAFGESNVFSEHFGGSIGYTSTSERNEETCTVFARVETGAYPAPLVLVHASIQERSGLEAGLSAVPTTITPYDGDWPNVVVSLRGEEWWAYATEEERIALNTEGGANVDIMGAQIVGKPLYSSGRLSAIGYTSNNVERNEYSAELTWETRDFILFDHEEQVYVYVLGEYVGNQGLGLASSTLKVSFVVDVRGAKSSYLLGDYAFTQIELLPQEPMGQGTSLNYLPAPKIRPLFVPMFQEQGDFRGAVYTVAAEVSNGAQGAALFNFDLRLEPYTSVGTHEDGEPVVRFVPCNLLEMLYAYVFSSKYGVDQFQRYPVDYGPRFTNIMNTLFSKTYRINYRDGAFIDWLDTLGGAYATESTTELYRI